MSPNKMKIPIKADTKAKRDQLVEDTKGNLPKNCLLYTSDAADE